MFDGPNIPLKLHLDRVNILRHIAIFVFGSIVWLEIAYSRPFLGVLADITRFPLELGTGALRQKTRVLTHFIRVYIQFVI